MLVSVIYSIDVGEDMLFILNVWLDQKETEMERVKYRICNETGMI